MAAPGAWAACCDELAELPGLLRLRYTTSHPRDMDDALIAAHRDVPMLMPFLHLPVQSGSDRMLAAMNRRHTAADYLRLVEKLRAARPDLALSSDFIVGHPGETEADFQATLALVREVGFAQAFSFKYSPRPGTPAAGAPAQVPEAEKERRLAELQALLREQQAGFNAGCVGMTLPVLFTGPGRHPGQVAGRSPFLQPVHVNGPADLIGQRNSGGDRRRAPQFIVWNPHRGESLRLSQATAIPAIPAASPSGKAVTLQFNDNTLLPLLLGDHDRHLVRIEQALGRAAVLPRQPGGDRRRGGAGRRGAGRAGGTVAAAGTRRERRPPGRGGGDPAGGCGTDPRLPLSDVPAIRTRRGRGGAAQPGTGGLYRGAGDA